MPAAVGGAFPCSLRCARERSPAVGVRRSDLARGGGSVGGIRFAETSLPSSTRLPGTVFAKHHGAPWRSAGGESLQGRSSSNQHPPSDFAPKSRAHGGERFRAQALRARECSPQGGRPHVHRDQRNEPLEGRPMSTATNGTNRPKADPMSTATSSPTASAKLMSSATK
jgi:hypothetical protein